MEANATNGISKDWPTFAGVTDIPVSAIETMSLLCNAKTRPFLTIWMYAPFWVKEFFALRLTDIKATKAIVQFAKTNIEPITLSNTSRDEILMQKYIVLRFGN